MTALPPDTGERPKFWAAPPSSPVWDAHRAAPARGPRPPRPGPRVASPDEGPAGGARIALAPGVDSCGPGEGGGRLPAGTPRPPGRTRKAAGRGRAVLRAAGGAMRALAPGRGRSSCLKGRRGTWLGRSSRPPGRSSEAGRHRSASATTRAPRRARQAGPRRAAERGTRQPWPKRRPPR